MNGRTGEDHSARLVRGGAVPEIQDTSFGAPYQHRLLLSVYPSDIGHTRPAPEFYFTPQKKQHLDLRPINRAPNVQQGDFFVDCLWIFLRGTGIEHNDFLVRLDFTAGEQHL
jgi:hypothetical protein